MRLKGISILERHVEKIVAGVFGVAALGVIALQFSRPTVVKVDTLSLAPDKAYGKIADKAKALEGRLNDPAAPKQIEEMVVPDIRASLDERMVKGVAPSPKLPQGIGRPQQRDLASTDGIGGRDLPRVAVVTPPAPSKPIAAVFGGTIDPVVVATTSGLERLVPAEQPYDKQAVSVQATFPSAEMIKRLEADPDGAGPLSPVPPFWWKSRVEALDVVLERQEAHEDGTFGETQVVPPMPGQPSLRADLIGDSKANFSEVVRSAREHRRDIVQPGFYALVAGEPWRRPEATVSTAGLVAGADEIANLQRDIKAYEAKIESLKAQRDKAPEKKAPVKGGAPGGGGGIGGGGGGMCSANPPSMATSVIAAVVAAAQQKSTTPSKPAASPTTGSTPAKEPAKDPEKVAEERKKAQFDKNIKEWEDKRDAAEARLRELGVSPDSEKDKPKPAVPVAAAKSTEPKPIESLEDLTVWAHDVTAVPGKAYRYRVRLAITNPLFGNARQLNADAQAGAEKPTTLSDPSEWSDVVRVGADTRVFFTSAFSQGAGGAALGGLDSMGAGVELWKFYYGYWRKVKATLKPGDALAASLPVPKDFATVWEIAKGDKPGQAAVKGEKPAPEKVAVDLGGFLLDVAPVALEGGANQAKRWQVVYRDHTGEVLVRWPDQDNASADRRALEASETAASQAKLSKPGSGASGSGSKPGQPIEPPANPTPTPVKGGGGLGGGG